MSQVTVENPDVHKTQRVNGNGRVYISKDLIGEDVEVIAKQVGEQEGED